MGKALGIGTAGGERPAIAGDLTKEQFPLLRHAVPMRVQPDVGNGWRPDLVRMHQGQESAPQELFLIDSQGPGESLEPHMLLVRRPPLPIGGSGYSGRGLGATASGGRSCCLSSKLGVAVLEALGPQGRASDYGTSGGRRTRWAPRFPSSRLLVRQIWVRLSLACLDGALSSIQLALHPVPTTRAW